MSMFTRTSTAASFAGTNCNRSHLRRGLLRLLPLRGTIATAIRGGSSACSIIASRKSAGVSAQYTRRTDRSPSPHLVPSRHDRRHRRSGCHRLMVLVEQNRTAAMVAQGYPASTSSRTWARYPTAGSGDRWKLSRKCWRSGRVRQILDTGRPPTGVGRAAPRHGGDGPTTRPGQSFTHAT